MNELTIHKALANPTRLNIVKWLKQPKKHFPQWNKSDQHLGVCCGFIQQKAGLSQSTISNYLSILEKSGLLLATRHKQWTYYRRNETVITQFAQALTRNL